MFLYGSRYRWQLAGNSGIDSAHYTLQFGKLPDHLANQIRLTQCGSARHLGFEPVFLLPVCQPDVHRFCNEFTDFGDTLGFLIHRAQPGLE